MNELNEYFEIVHPRKTVVDYGMADWRGPRPTVLSDVYNTYSVHKQNAFIHWQRVCDELGGFDFCITSHNCMRFCIAFKFVYNGEPYIGTATGVHSHAYKVNLDTCDTADRRAKWVGRGANM